MGVIPFARAPFPRRRTTRAPTQKPSWKMLNTAWLLVCCWLVSFLFCRVSFLAGLFASGSSFGLVCLGGFRVAFLPRRRATSPELIFFLTGIPPCRLQYWAAITPEVTPEHGLVDKVLFDLSPSSYAVAGPERSDGCIFLVCGFRTTLRRHCGQLLRQRRFFFFLRYLGFFLGSNKWIHGTTCCCVASDSCVEVFVSTVGPLGVCILVSVMATPAPTSATSMAPTMI